MPSRKPRRGAAAAPSADAPRPSAWRSNVSWATWTLIALSVPFTAFAVFQAAGDPSGDSLWGVAFFLAPAVITGYAVLEMLWTRAHLINAAAFRMTAIPAVAAAVSTVTIAVTYALPALQAVLARTRRDDGGHYWLGAEIGNPWLLTLTAGFAAGALAGLLVWVVIVTPVAAIRRPREFADANMMSTESKDFENNRRAGIALSFLLILIFAIPTLTVVGSHNATADDVVELFADLGWTVSAPSENLGEIAWLLGLLLIPLAVWLTWYVWKTQRVDRARRAAAGVPMGLPGPGHD